MCAKLQIDAKLAKYIFISKSGVNLSYIVIWLLNSEQSCQGASKKNLRLSNLMCKKSQKAGKKCQKLGKNQQF